MLVEDLIAKLSEIPKGTHVCIADILKNIHYSDESPEGNSHGIEPNFYVEYITEDVTEPFVALFFNNDDYNDGGIYNPDIDISNN